MTNTNKLAHSFTVVIPTKDFTAKIDEKLKACYTAENLMQKRWTMTFVKLMINQIKKYFFRSKTRDISDCFAPMTVVYHSGYEAYKNGWSE